MNELYGNEREAMLTFAKETEAFQTYQEYFQDLGYDVQDGPVFEREVEDQTQSLYTACFAFGTEDLSRKGEMEITLKGGEVVNAYANMDIKLDDDYVRLDEILYEDGDLIRKTESKQM